MRTVALSSSKIVIWLSALLLFLFIRPYFLWEIMSDRAVTIAMSFLLCAFFYMNRGKISAADRRISLLFIFTVLYYIIRGLIMAEMTINGVISRSILFLYVIIPFAKDSFSKQVYNSFLTIYSAVIAISLLSYVGVMIGAISAIGTISNGVGDHLREYTVYPFLVMDRGYDLIRFYGLFNEPGVVGTLSALLLCIQKFRLNDIRVVIILISGVLSFSLFFYILLLSYSVIYLLMVKRDYLLCLIFISAFGIFYLKTRDNPVLYETIWERIEWDSTDHQFKGDNRRNEIVDDYYDDFKKTPSFWYGSTREELDRFWNLVYETSSYKVVVITDGMIFLFFYLLFFVLYAYHHKRSIKEFLLFVLVLLANTYQRADIYYIQMIFLYTYFARSGLEINTSKNMQSRQLRNKNDKRLTTS